MQTANSNCCCDIVGWRYNNNNVAAFHIVLHISLMLVTGLKPLECDSTLSVQPVDADHKCKG